jgi:acetyl-CoA acetyltransferase
VPAVSFQSAGSTSLTERAARHAYETAGIEPSDVNIVECQDTDAASELFAYRDLGLCAAGDEAKLLHSGDTALGGAVPVNPSGGLLSKGEPLGASGLGQIHELVQQLRGRSGVRQVDGARCGVGHVMGAGHNASVVVVTR